MKDIAPWYIGKAHPFGIVHSSALDESHQIYFLIQFTPELIKRLKRLMDAVKHLTTEHPEVTSAHAFVDGPTYFFAPPDGMMSALSAALKGANVDEALNDGYVKIKRQSTEASPAPLPSPPDPQDLPFMHRWLYSSFSCFLVLP